MEFTSYGSIEHDFETPKGAPFERIPTNRQHQIHKWVAIMGCLSCIVTSYILVQMFSSKTIQDSIGEGNIFNLPTSDLIEVIQSSGSNNDRFVQTYIPMFQGPYSVPDSTTIRISPEIQYQTILGFGGAFTEAAGYVVSKLSKNTQDEIINAYFGPPETSLGYTMGRTHINSCDFSLASYCYDYTADDYSLKDFDIEHDKLYLLPFIHRALNATPNGVPFRLVSSPWSPPAWMKGNHAMDRSSSPGLINTTQIHEAWALYLSKYVSAYHAEGVDVWGITVQNEPANDAPWEACVYNAEQERDFVSQYLGPQISKDHPSVQLIMLDHNRDMVPHWADVILSDPSASRYIDGIGIHWYKGNSPSLSQYDNLDYANSKFPKQFILATEATYCPGVKLGDWSRGEAYGWDILNDLLHWSVGWIDWNLVLNTEGGPNHLGNRCDSPIIADPKTDTFVFQPYYFFLGHFSKYIRPGAIRLGTTVGTPLACRLKLSVNPSDACASIAWTCKFGGISCSPETIPSCWQQVDDFPSVKALADDIFDQYYQKNKNQGPYACNFNGIASIEGVQSVAFNNTDGTIAGVVLNVGDLEVDYNLAIGNYVAPNTISPHSIQTFLY